MALTIQEFIEQHHKLYARNMELEKIMAETMLTTIIIGLIIGLIGSSIMIRILGTFYR